MTPTKRLHTLLPFPYTLHTTPLCHSSSKPRKKQRDQPRKAMEDSFLGERILAKEWRKRPRKTWNRVGDDEHDGVLEESPFWNMLRLRSPPLQQCNKGSGVPRERLDQSSIAASSPLGLRLRKSTSLVNMIQMQLAHDARVKGQCTTSGANRGVLDTRSVTKPTPKASQFHASILRIGAWEWESRYDGDLVAKFYYTNNKLVWEILNKGLKSKMEIDWPDISALRVTCPEGGPGTLEIMCAPGILNAHIVKLLSCSHRLYSLSQENTIDQENPCFEQWHSEFEVQGSSSTQDLYHRYYSHEFWPQKFGEPVSMSIGTNVVGRNHNGSQQEGMPILIPSSAPKCASVITRTSSGGLQLQGDAFNCNNSSFQTPRRTQLSISNGRTMNDTASYMANPSKRQNLNLASIGTSSSSLIRPEDVRKFVKDIRLTNQLDSSWVTPMYSDGSSSQKMMELDLSNYVFNNTAQTFQQIDPRNPSSNDNATMAAMALEKLSHYLLSDSDIEPAGAAEEAVIMSRVNSLSKLSQQDPAQSSQASNATCAPPPPIDFEAEAATQVLDGDSCRGNGLLPSTGMESMPWQQEPVVDIEMDMAYLSELLPFCP